MLVTVVPEPDTLAPEANRSPSRRRRVLPIVALVVVAVVGAAAVVTFVVSRGDESAAPQSAGPADTGPPELELMWSTSADVGESADLAGATISGGVYLFARTEVPVSGGRFFVDGEVTATEPAGPVDVGEPVYVDTTSWDNGQRSITYRAFGIAGEQLEQTATVTVSNQPERGSLWFVDDFEGDSLNTEYWAVYRDRQNMWGVFEPDNVSVEDGTLTLETRVQADGSLSVAGVSNLKFGSRTYGEYEIRVRLDAADGTRGVGLLWPQADKWPPEIDFYEVLNADRSVNLCTVHYGPKNDRKQSQCSYEADFTQWQTVGVRWLPNKVEFTLNGEVVQSTTRGVPDEDMWLALQHHLRKPNADAAPGTPDVVRMEVDWVKIWELTP